MYLDVDGRCPHGYVAATSFATTASRATKRAQDVLVAALALVALSPILIIVAVAICLESRGPVLYRCRRVGFGGRQFDMLKFRKMVDGAGGPPLRAVDDERYTRIGRFLARSSLDELPQLWNVLKGDMSLVGPRPEDPSFVQLEERAFRDILRVRPGMTGLSQLAFTCEAEILDPDDRLGNYVSRILPQKLEIDRLYAERRSAWMDLKILVWTVAAVVLRRDVAVHRGTGALGVRRRPASQASTALANLNGRVGMNGNGNGTQLAVQGNGAASRDGDGALAHTQIVILAGGRGTRLAPYTTILPKPLMPVGERSILETIVEQLAAFGARKVSLCVGYLSQLIMTVFENRPSGPVEVCYVHEHDALGTAAPLRLVPDLDDTFIVMNGDVLTTLDYGALLRHHRESGNLLTIATHDRRIKIDYGMLHLDVAGRVREYEEKPEIVSSVSMGIYVVEPGALAYIPEEGYFDFPSLVEELLRAGEPVGAYRYDGMWFDIGRPTDYEDAVAAWSERLAS